jgi:hypothetical protein
MEKDKRRGERRDRTSRHGRRAQQLHLRFVHPSGAVDCICERSVWYFRKWNGLSCRCRAKQKGAPKIPGGRCSRGDHHYRDTVVERIRGRRLAHEWLQRLGGQAPEDIEL